MILEPLLKLTIQLSLSIYSSMRSEQFDLIHWLWDHNATSTLLLLLFNKHYPVYDPLFLHALGPFLYIVDAEQVLGLN